MGFTPSRRVEKSLKAVLLLKGVQFRRTHDLVELIDLVRDAAIKFPTELEEVRRLTPFAATLRYEDASTEQEEPFDRAWALDCVRRARAWAEGLVSV